MHPEEPHPALPVQDQQALWRWSLELPASPEGRPEAR
jgi:hypothetical protein